MNVEVAIVCTVCDFQQTNKRKVVIIYSVDWLLAFCLSSQNQIEDFKSLFLLHLGFHHYNVFEQFKQFDLKFENIHLAHWIYLFKFILYWNCKQLYFNQEMENHEIEFWYCFHVFILIFHFWLGSLCFECLLLIWNVSAWKCMVQYP